MGQNLVVALLRLRMPLQLCWQTESILHFVTLLDSENKIYRW